MLKDLHLPFQATPTKWALHSSAPNQYTTLHQCNRMFTINLDGGHVAYLSEIRPLLQSPDYPTEIFRKSAPGLCRRDILTCTILTPLLSS